MIEARAVATAKASIEDSDRVRAYLGVLAACAATAILLVLSICAPGMAFGIGQGGGGSGVDLQAGAAVPETQADETSTHASAYAVYKKDGFVYRADSSGSALAGGAVWGSLSLGDLVDDNLGNVDVLFIDSDVQKIDDTFSMSYYPVKGVSALKTSALPTGKLKSVRTLVFRTGKDGGSACTYIGNLAFNGMRITSVQNLEKTRITTLRAAFAQCKNLERVALPNTCKTVEGTFEGCTSLKSVSFGSGITSIGSLSFCRCASLASVDLPASLRELGVDSFKECTSLKQVVLRSPSRVLSHWPGRPFSGTPVEGEGGVGYCYVPSDLVSSYEKAALATGWGALSNICFKPIVGASALTVTYNGRAQTPAATVTYLGKKLVVGRDCAVSYSNNVNAGIGRINVVGLGSYRGVANGSGTFTINRASIGKAVVTGVVNKPYTGNRVEQKPRVTLSGRTLVPGQDYLITYKNNRSAGKAAVVMTGKGNYIGRIERSFAIKAPSVSYCTHVQTFGWQHYVADGEISGTTGQSKRLEGIRIKLASRPDGLGGSIQYRTHIQTFGWERGWKADGAMSGTTGQSKRLEAIQIRLTGSIAAYYDVYYRVHAQHYGWMGWARNGQSAGTAGYSYRLEGIQIRLVPKGGNAPGTTANRFRQR